MKEYLLSIVGVTLLTAILSLVLPNGKMAPIIRTVCKISCLAVLLSPFFQLLSEGEVPSTAPIVTNVEYLENCKRMAEESEGEQIRLYLAREYDVTANVDVECEGDLTYSVKKIALRVLSFGINSEGEHTYIMTKIKTALKDLYGCEVSVN